MKDNYSRDCDEVVDIYGCERCFIPGLLTPQMILDFPLIASTFLEKRMISGYSVDSYANEDSAIYSPMQCSCYFFLNSIYEAYKQGDVVSQDLLLLLYKTYHKKEYNQLKRFHIITVGDVLTIADVHDLDGGIALGVISMMARIVCMSKIMGIEISSDCNELLSFFNDVADDFPDNDYDEILAEYESKVTDELMMNCSSRAEELLSHDIKELEEYDDIMRDYVSSVFASKGYPKNYLGTLWKEKISMHGTYMETLLHYRLVAGGNDFSIGEIAALNMLTRCIDIFLSQIKMYNTFVKGMADSEWYRSFYPDAPFKPELLPNRMNGVVPTASESATKEIMPTSIPDTSSLADKVKELQSRLHLTESTVKQLKNQASELKLQLHKAETANNVYEEERKELIALREYVYNMTEKEDAAPSYTTAAMKEALTKKNILIVGGHSNWVGKLKNEFPNWKFVAPNVSNTVSVSLIQNADKVYFFTDTLGHSNYHKFLNSIREQEVPFGYIHGVNITTNIQYLYNDLCSND